jgi:hypothetical protein
MVKSAGSAIHHAHTYGGETKKLIAVKLAVRKFSAGDYLETLGTGRILSERL